jgi:hypothetical protein
MVRRSLIFLGFAAAFLVLGRAMWFLFDWWPRQPSRPGETDPFAIFLPYILGLGIVFCAGLCILLVLLLFYIRRGRLPFRAGPSDDRSSA